MELHTTFLNTRIFPPHTLHLNDLTTEQQDMLLSLFCIHLLLLRILFTTNVYAFLNLTHMQMLNLRIQQSKDELD